MRAIIEDVSEAAFERHRRDLRASHADRERAVDFIRHHAAEGRLTTEELADRVGSALTAVTLGELDDLVVDLPPESARALEQAVPASDPPWQRPGALRALRFASLGLLLVSFGASGRGASVLFVVWLVMMVLFRFARRSARRRTHGDATFPPHQIYRPVVPDLPPLSEWHPPSPDDVTWYAGPEEPEPGSTDRFAS